MKNYVLCSLLLVCSMLQAQDAFQHTTVAGNLSNVYMSTLSHKDLDNRPDAIVLITPVRGFNNTPERNDHYKNNYGVWYNPVLSKWVIFTENKTPMPLNMTFNVLVAPSGKPNYFSYTVTAKDREQHGFNHGALFSNPASDKNEDAIVIVTHNGGKGKVPMTNDNSLIVSYKDALGKWGIGHNGYLANFVGLTKSEQSFMKDGTMFNIMVVDAKSCSIDNPIVGLSNASAILHTADACKIYNIVGGFSTTIDNVKSNDTKTAMVFVTPNWGWGGNLNACGDHTHGPYNESPVCVQYGYAGNGWFKENRWAIVNALANPLAQGTKFNVVIVNK
jgi:hypothetical protein